MVRNSHLAVGSFGEEEDVKVAPGERHYIIDFELVSGVWQGSDWSVSVAQFRLTLFTTILCSAIVFWQFLPGQSAVGPNAHLIQFVAVPACQHSIRSILETFLSDSFFGN